MIYTFSYYDYIFYLYVLSINCTNPTLNSTRILLGRHAIFLSIASLEVKKNHFSIGLIKILITSYSNFAEI